MDDVNFRRNLFSGNTKHRRIELHAFRDASEKAYGAALYVKSKRKDRTVPVRLCAKYKVVPLKATSRLWLQLQATALTTTLATQVKWYQVHFWSNPKVVFAWLRN